MAKSKKPAKPTSDGPASSNGTPTPSWLHDGLPLPRLIVLDLDYTLWPFYSDIHISTPIRLVPNSNPPTLADRNGEHFALYPDAPHILRLISSLPNTRLAVASKSPVGDLCREVLKLLRLPPGEAGSEKGPKRTIDAFDAGLEIYEGTKLRHFEVIAKRTGIPFSQMLFFDDERPNLEVESLGVTMRLIRDGLTWEELERGIMQWRANQGVE
jgi:magnesium-dependent phosphatase 1